MATNLAGPINIGELNACVVRAARLDADCSPTGGVSTGIITAALVTMTASPVVAEGTAFTQKNACGNTMFTVNQDDKINGYTFTGEFGFSDFEMMSMLFGGSTILGRAAGSFAGKVIGYADPLYNAPTRNGVYLEVITTTVAEGAGDCISSTGSVPVALGHIFGKVKLTPGDLNFQNDIKRITFTGKGVNNPALFDGPWNDYPGAGYIPNTAHLAVGYSQTEYNAILAAVTVGFTDTPAGS